MHVLLVKLTSMGDLIHALPAITDATQAIPGIRFDWVIDESFAEVASWHPTIERIIPSAHRRWRKHYRHHLPEIKQFVHNLRARHYDYVIDGQTNLKAALVTAFTRGLKCGFDKKSAREYPAHWVYKRKITVDKKEHAVSRLRQLFAKALGYDLANTPPDFGIDRTLLHKPELDLPERYVVFVHNASWQTKLWPEAYWQQLIALAVEAGLHIVLPAGNAEELARSQRLAAQHASVTALPRLSLSHVAYILANAQGAVCVDTGLSHLAGALNVPTVTLYGATDSGLIGATGLNQLHCQSGFACAPCYRQQCNYPGASSVQPACFEELTPKHVWHTLQSLIH
jgi:heptosyltransferase-1